MMRFVIVFLFVSLLLVSGCATEATQSITGEFLDDGRVTCPNGMVDDPAPGSCGLYTDENDNNICDYSE
jgi:hypothetical protein